MKILVHTTAALMLAALVPLSAQAALFSDDEARRAILDLRAQVNAINARIDGKADKTSSLDLSGQNDQLRSELARLRGQIEVLANDVNNAQRRQKDFYADLDARLRKLEPRLVKVDGKDVEVFPAEEEAYNAAMALFKAGDYGGAGQSFTHFLRLYPQSGYAGSANYWLGNAYYAQRDYKNALAALQVVVNSYPDNPNAADALLNVASAQVELKDRVSARQSLEAVVARYPDSEAAQSARQRLSTFK